MDFIRLVRNKADSVISDTDYQNYMNMLKSSSLPATYIETEGGEEKAVSSSATSQADYFTSHLSGDSRLWVMDNSSFFGAVAGHNDDYSGSGDWSWGLASRVGWLHTVKGR